MLNSNLTAWGKIKPILNKKHVSFAALSVSYDCNNSVIIQKLSEKLGESIVFEVLSELNVEIFDETTSVCTIARSDNDFILCDNGFSYLVNPYDSTLLQQVHLYAKQLGIQVKNIGVISQQSKILGKKPTENTVSYSNAHNILNRIIVKSIDRNATDIHIYPRNEKYVFIKLRINGQLMESGIDDISFKNYKLLANTLLDLSKKNPGAYSNFQEAKFDYICETKNLSVRLQMNPTIYQFKDSGKMCPSFVLRIHKIDKVSFRSIDSLGFVEEHEQILKRSAKYNQGLILVSGPTNSGKTTALYGILAETMMHRDVCVQTVEDPVEVELPGVKQLDINEESGVSYASALKSILRSDVDVALIGEIRDSLTAQKAIELDKTGHLVLSTLHTKCSLAIIDRLRQFGVSNADISDSLSVLISTRLLPEVCRYCSTEIRARDDVRIMEKFKHKFKDLNTKIKERNLKGCKHCDGGYSGRLMAAEVFFIDDAIKNMIARGAGRDEIYKYITKENKSQTIWDHAFVLLINGETSFDALEQSLPAYIN